MPVIRRPGRLISTFLILSSCFALANAAEVDLLIENAMVVDGTGNPWQAVDVGIVGDKIAAVGQLGWAQAGRTIDAAGKFVCSHWDGDTRPLLKYAWETGLDGIEAITPKPQGDVTIDEIREALGDKMFLLDGIPAVYFDDTYSNDLLIESVHHLIDLFAPRLVLGISDEISSTGDLLLVKTVGEIVDKYNSRFDR